MEWDSSYPTVLVKDKIELEKINLYIRTFERDKTK